MVPQNPLSLMRARRNMCSKEVFQEQFWWCYERFKEAATPEIGVPGYFRFMTLLGEPMLLCVRACMSVCVCVPAFTSLFSSSSHLPPSPPLLLPAALKIMLAQGVDVLLLEVGVGGRLDATNVIRHPVVCGITSLGMDHVEMLGDTLPVRGSRGSQGTWGGGNARGEVLGDAGRAGGGERRGQGGGERRASRELSQWTDNGAEHLKNRLLH